MAGKTNLYETHIESIVKWLSCNGEAWGMGPTVVFASAAALFLYNELQATVFLPGDHPRVSVMEKTLISTMVLGMLALMIHLWVCSMRFFQYYLDTLIKDSPTMLLEITTAGLLGKSEVLPIGPLSRFLKQQQPQIHITVCWFLSLCYADYVRKHYCTRFNLPYLEQWQTELHERASNGVHTTMQKVNSFVGGIHRRLRNYTSPPADVQTESAPPKHSSVEVRGATSVSWAPLSSQCLSVPLSGRPSVSLSSPSVCARLLNQSSETTAHAVAQLRRYIALLIRAKCGETYLSTIPTFFWAVGSAALAHRIISVMFRRFMFRRVPLWELIVQHLLFIWMIIYSLHFWAIVVNVTKFFIEYCYIADIGTAILIEDEESCKMMQQWMIWMFSIAPLAIYLQTRPKPAAPPLMIWITASPWQRREMGAYGYYLSRPFSSLEPSRNVSIRQQAFALRKAFSDSKTVIKEPPKKRRNSKSI